MRAGTHTSASREHVPWERRDRESWTVSREGRCLHGDRELRGDCGCVPRSSIAPRAERMPMCAGLFVPSGPENYIAVQHK